MIFQLSASVGPTEALADTSEQPNRFKDIPRRGEQNMPGVCTSVNYSPHFSGLFHTNHYSEYQVVEVPGGKHRFLCNKIILHRCLIFPSIFPVVLNYLWWSGVVGKLTIPSVILIKHADLLSFLKKESVSKLNKCCYFILKAFISFSSCCRELYRITPRGAMT